MDNDIPRVGFATRLACATACAWRGIWAPWDGGNWGGTLGWRIAPRFGFWGNLLTLYCLPFIFAGICGGFGATLGGFAMTGSLVEACAQLLLAQPYKKPVSRLLIEWLPQD